MSPTPLTCKECPPAAKVFDDDCLVLAVALERACHFLLLLALGRWEVGVEPVEAGADADLILERWCICIERERAPVDDAATEAGEKALGGGVGDGGGGGGLAGLPSVGVDDDVLSAVGCHYC